MKGVHFQIFVRCASFTLNHIKPGGSDIQMSRGLLNFLLFFFGVCFGLSVPLVCSLPAFADLSVSFGPVSLIESTLHYGRGGGVLSAFVRIVETLQRGVGANAGHLLRRTPKQNRDTCVHAIARVQFSGPFDLTATEVLGTFQSDEYEDFYRHDVDDLEDVGVNVVKENNQAEVRTPSEQKKKKKKRERENSV